MIIPPSFITHESRTDMAADIHDIKDAPQNGVAKTETTDTAATPQAPTIDDQLAHAEAQFKQATEQCAEWPKRAAYWEGVLNGLRAAQAVTGNGSTGAGG